jgi:hypothetical protein
MDHLWLAVIPFVTAGVGAYLGAYLKKKGENLATHEDIENTVAQVGAVPKPRSKSKLKSPVTNGVGKSAGN